MLNIKKLSLIKRGKLILNDLSLEIPQGRITLLLGKSGSGKTSLLRCLSQVEQEYEGRVLYEEKDLRNFSPQMRSRLIGFVQQSFPLFPHLNVLENCSQPLKLHSSLDAETLREKVVQMLEALDMKKYTTSKPHELSGGQQQRVAIARALLLNPSFMLFDEPTSALDPENRDLLLRILQKLREENKGIVISSQDVSFIERVLDRVYFIAQGNLEESYDTVVSLKQIERAKAWLREGGQ